MENNQNTQGGKIYSVNFTEKQMNWLIDVNQALTNLNQLNKRGLITSIDVGQFCQLTTDILGMIIRESQKK